VRIWDTDTETPKFTCKGHDNWVLVISFSPNGKYIASGDMDGNIFIWDPLTGNRVGSCLKGHKKFITALSWEPVHKNPKCSRFASASKDGTVRIWDIELGRAIQTLSGHTASVTCVRWGGMGLIYTGSQDRTVKVYNADDGKLCKTLEGHAHWVNSLALSTDHALRTGSFDHTGKVYTDLNEAQKYALERYTTLRGKQGERLASCSDDFTIHLWDPENSKKPIIRMTGHQQPINLVSFSPDGRLLASASFDKSLKIWDGVTGKFKASLRGHVGAVYQVCWSSDSRMLVSGSKDSTLKLWDLSNGSLKVDLPGHADEVYSVDWSPDGQRVASGSKDRMVKIWRN
jgi:ribosome assembly protein 4